MDNVECTTPSPSVEQHVLVAPIRSGRLLWSGDEDFSIAVDAVIKDGKLYIYDRLIEIFQENGQWKYK